MSHDSAILARVEHAMGGPVKAIRPVGGGDINDAFSLEIGGRGRFFLKLNARAPARMFETEARGLAFLREAGSDLIVPRVHASDERFLVMELLEATSTDCTEQLGRGLAQLHRAAPPTFGLDEDNFIGTLAQHNPPSDDWLIFFRDHRLSVQLSLPGARRAFSSGQRAVFDRLLNKLDQLLGPNEPPARLHGDLWGGNWMATTEGPAIFDPAVYGGHREVDLAMMRLFGGYGSRVFAAYEEAYPLSPGAEDRVELYQLYPILVHANLFGGGYAASALSIAQKYV